MIAVIALFLIAGAADSETRRVGDGFEYLGMARTALMLGVCWLLARAGAGFVAVLFAAMLLSWVDKAHAEIFIAALTGGALLLRATAPAVALVLLGVAAAQMPVLIVLLVACAAESLLRGGARARIAAGVAAGLAIAALHPLYYLWRLGIASPLPDTVIAPAPTLLATIVWTRPPAFENPLPEVFSERTAHIDGIAPMPVATVRCEKALIVATDAGVSWPPSCVPRAVPAECRTPGALCYANDARVVQAPGQPGFSR